VHAFRGKIPEMTISTDIIAGFPSETEDDFQETIDLLERSQPDIVNISRYAARPGTEAYRWKGIRVNSQVSKKRSECLHALTRRIAKKRNSLWRDWQGEIVIDEIGKVRQGRNYAYKPVVISPSTSSSSSSLPPPSSSSTTPTTRATTTTITAASDRQISPGDKVHVKIYDFSNFSLKAKIIL
jgi:threonylcarbamoyladenosine tRNA methylthiotransferase CDKAL1